VVFATYGMTETITHVAVLRLNCPEKAEEFSGLPNVRFDTDERGCLVISAPHVSAEVVVTNDMVALHSPTRFSWLGRYDNVVNSGGVKIFPEQVEKKLAPYIDIPFIIASEKDEELGERVVLILEHDGQTTLTNYASALEHLTKFERPKKVYTLSKFPYTETAKIKRAEVVQVMKKYK
jgi:O-succinylbenzoic acid--CoA ligase